MNGKNINLTLLDKRIKILSIDDYIKKSLARRFILLFIISIIPFAISSYIINSYETLSSYQKSKLAFESKQNLVVTKIENSIKQIAHINGFRMYVQSSDISREKDKYTLLNKIEISLLNSPLIEGIELYPFNRKSILQAGSKTNTSVIYKLKYTNDFIDEYGVTIGTIKAYLSIEALTEELKSNLYDISFTSLSSDSLPIISLGSNNKFLQIFTNERVTIQPKIERSNYWLYYLGTIIFLLILYFIIIRKIFSRITQPIKDIESTAFSESLSKSPVKIKIKELIWIKKIIENIKIAKKNTKKNTDNKSEVLIKSFIDTLHSLKSNISSIKMIADAEIKNNMLNERITGSLDNTINSINEYKELTKTRNEQQELKLISIATLVNTFQAYDNTLLVIKIEDNLLPSCYDFFVPLSTDDIKLIISNIANNAIEAGATQLIIECNFNNNALIIDISNDGERLNLDLAHEYLMGKSTKLLGTGTGISSIHQVLKSARSTLNFVFPKHEFYTTISINLRLLNNDIHSIVDYIKSKVTISEIIIVDDIVRHHRFEDISVNLICSNEVHNYMELSRKADILENQLYIHDIDFFISTGSYNVVLLNNNKVINIKSLITT